MPTTNITGGSVLQTVCAQPWLCQWKGADRMESVLRKNWFTFSQHDKWWTSTNNLGKI